MLNLNGAISLLLLSFCFGCSNPQDNNNISENTTDNTTYNTSENTTIETNRREYVVPPIPDDIAHQTYKDVANNTVPYDHKKQLTQLFNLEKEGKKLYLILGRGNKEMERHADLPDENGKIVWVYGEIDGNQLVSNDIPHLYMDFDKSTHLATIPDELFDEIVFDWSVVKFFNNIESSVIEFKRILKPGGKFLADLLMGTIGFMRGNSCNYETSRLYKTTSGYNFCMENIYSTSVQFHMQTYANNTIRDFYMNEVFSRRRELIGEYLSNLFGEAKCIYHQNGSPVTENTDDYFECTK